MTHFVKCTLELVSNLLLNKVGVTFLSVKHEIADISRIESVDPPWHHQCLMQQFNFLIVFACFVVSSRHISRKLQLLCVNVDNLFDHSVEQVHPLLTVLHVSFARFVLLQSYDAICISLLSVKVAELWLEVRKACWGAVFVWARWGAASFGVWGGLHRLR